MASRLQITREGVIQGLLEAVQLAKEQANPAGMVAGLREIGKMLGYYAPETKRVEVGLSATAERQRFEAMSDEELLSHIERFQEAA